MTVFLINGATKRRSHGKKISHNPYCYIHRSLIWIMLLHKKKKKKKRGYFCNLRIGKCFSSRIRKAIKKRTLGASPVVQGLRIHLPTQGTWVQFLVWKIPHDTEQLSTCTTNCQAPALELTGHSY